MSPNKNLFHWFFPEESIRKNATYLFLILVLYSVAVFMGIINHEMWRDELEPWLVGSSSHSLSGFFHNMKMGSNPYIWYLILHFLSRITLNPVIVQVAHGSFAIAAIYLFLRFSPFSLLQKFLFCFGYYVLYEYGIISRGYALTIFFLFLFCAAYKKYWNRTIPLALVIFFLANATGGFGAILSISLLVFLVSNYYLNRISAGRGKQDIKYTGWTALIILFSVWIAIKSIAPPPDSVYATKWFTEFNFNRFAAVFCRLWSGFMPIPALSGIHFMNTNIIMPGRDAGFENFFLVTISFAFLAVNTLIFSRKLPVLLFYLCGTCGILLFSYLSGPIFAINASRYNGFLYIIFLVSFWLLLYLPEKEQVLVFFLTPLAKKLKVDTYQNEILTFFLMVNVVACAIAYWKDFKYPFSNITKTGKYIVSNNLQRYAAAGFVDYTVSPISAYTRKPFYYPDRDTTSTFPVWTRKNYATDPNVVMERLLNRISRTNDTFLVVLNFDMNTSLMKDVQFSHLADFKGSIVQEESFSLFLACKYNLMNDLAIPTPLTEERIANYISLMNTLVQNDKVEECEKVIDRIKAKMQERPVAKFHVYQGLFYLKKNRPDKAILEFEKEIDLNLQKDEAYFQLGLLYAREEKIDSAIIAWEKTVSLNSGNIDAYANLGVCYLNFRKDLNKAEGCWNRTVQLNPDYGPGYLNLLIICQNRKDDAGMLKYLRLALQKGISPEEIRKSGITISDELLRKANP